jgi:hypothetical protein
MERETLWELTFVVHICLAPIVLSAAVWRPEFAHQQWFPSQVRKGYQLDLEGGRSNKEDHHHLWPWNTRSHRDSNPDSYIDRLDFL